MLCWFYLVSIIITYSLDLENCFFRAWRGVALMCASPDVPRMVRYRPRRSGGRWDLHLVAIYYLTNEVFNNPLEKMKLLNGKSMLWSPRVAPDRGCYPRPLAAPIPRFPLFSPCDAPVELENVRNQSAFHLISYSFAWVSLLSMSTFRVQSSLREACSRFLTLSFVGRGLESCTNYALTGIPLEKVTAVRHSKELEMRSDVQGEFTQVHFSDEHHDLPVAFGS